MGREIRRVPKDWQHPKKDNGHYQPMHDKAFEDACNEWYTGLQEWLNGENTQADEFGYPKTVAGYINCDGGTPDADYYRAEQWTEEQACCYQYYENVTEGTPLSPVFETLQQLEDWLVQDQGHSRAAAKNFCKSGYAPSMIFIPDKGFRMGIDSCE